MTVDKQTDVDQNYHGEEIESFRRELDSMLERKRSQLEQELQQALRRMELLCEESEKSAASEWNDYENRLLSAREELYERSREEMSRLLGAQIQDKLQDESIGNVLERILPEAKFRRMAAKK